MVNQCTNYFFVTILLICFSNELEKFEKDGILSKLLVSYSRDETYSGPRYVQDNILQHSATIGRMICEHNALIYVCGDAKGMAKSVFEAIINVVQDSKGCFIYCIYSSISPGFL
jgi:methionine synthase reductase